MYVGRRIRQLKDGLVLQDWEKYIRERLAPVEVTRERRREREAKCTEREVSQLRAVLGVLGWAAREGRFDAVGSRSLLTSSFPQPTVQDLLDVNQVVERLLKSAHLTTKLHPVANNNMSKKKGVRTTTITADYDVEIVVKQSKKG